MNNPDGKDRTTVENVDSDYGDPAKAEDWFELCNLNAYVNAIDYIGVFIDESSTKFDTVEASAILLARKLRCAGISVDFVHNASEDWIQPFVTSLKPEGPDGTTECGEYDVLCGPGQSCNQGICEGIIVEDECTTPT